MRIVFVHHHLRPGGVSRVISQQISSLGEAAKVLLIVGEPPSHPPSFPWVVIPSLAYDRDRKEREDPKSTASAVMREAGRHWRSGADVFHIHNPTLGKNSDLLAVIKSMISAGQRVLLQIHDFAEDGRPLNYSPEQYPSDSHYAVLNSRDYKILLKSGLRPEGLHLIPNAVVPLGSGRDQKKREQMVLYPVRAIRRKNIGEAVFLSLFLRAEERVGITLEPTGELDCTSYKDWRRFVRDENLRVQFRLGIDNPFEEVLKRSRCMITTSIKEGFGYCFLEPWTCSKMLFGRALPDICADFIDHGIDLNHLYKKIMIPLSFIDGKRLFTTWRRCYAERLEYYGIQVSAARIEEGIDSIIEDGCIDFGYLDEKLQKEVILSAIRSRNTYKKILDLNPFLIGISSFIDLEGIVEGNRKIVEERYSLEDCRVRLLGIYRKVMDIGVKHSIQKRILLEAFNTPDKAHLLLCDSAYG